MALTHKPLIHQDPKADAAAASRRKPTPTGRKPPWLMIGLMAALAGIAAYMYLLPSGAGNGPDPQINKHAEEIGEALRKNEPPPVVPKPEAPPPGYDAPKSIRGKK